MNKASLSLIAALTAFSSGCALEQPSSTDEPRVRATLSLSASSAEPGLSGFLFTIKSLEAEFTTQRYVPLQGEPLTSSDEQARFADAFFTVAPGRYDVTSQPMKDAQTPSTECNAAHDEVKVTSGATAEMTLVSTCGGQGSAGLDVTGTTRRGPIIDEVTFDRSKFVLACERVTATVKARFSGLKRPRYGFRVVSAPEQAIYSQTAAGPSLALVARTPGDYEIEATACEADGSNCSPLRFPIHVQLLDDMDGDGQGDTCDKGSLAPPIYALRVDPKLKPALGIPSLTEPKELGTRPLSTIRMPSGAQSDFVNDELIVQADDEAALQALVARYRGEILARLTPPLGVSTGSAQKLALVRVDVSDVDPSALPSLLATVGWESIGEHQVSDEAGLRLLTAALSESARSGPAAAAANFVLPSNSFENRDVREGGPGNACDWPYMSRGSVQDIGVCEAWRSLSLSGRLGARVPAVVYDGGFQRMPDVPADAVYVPNVGDWNLTGVLPATPNPYPCTGGSPCPWHGLEVTYAMAGIANNGRAAAGPGGPVVQPVMVQRPAPDVYFLIDALNGYASAAARGPRVFNMSFTGGVPAGWAPIPGALLNGLFALMRLNGTLPIAAAGNDGSDVDRVASPFLWEESWVMPCENANVLCVGGMDADARSRHPASNFGSNFGIERDTVDLFAPFTLWVGPTPTESGLELKMSSGTSFSAPFVGGIASLVWAANPSLSPDAVERVLLTTGHRGSAASDVPLWVDAFRSVGVALGSELPPENTPPVVEITGPTDGARISLHRNGVFVARTHDAEGDLVDVTWTLVDTGETLGRGLSVLRRFDVPGTFRIRATASDPRGAMGSDTVEITVANDPPQPVIDFPSRGAEVLQFVSLTLQGHVLDLNSHVPCSSWTWATDDLSDPIIPSPVGCSPTIVFGHLGHRRVTLSVQDEDGATTETSVDVNVIDDPDSPRPSIVLPVANASFDWNAVVQLQGDATDPQADLPLSFEWIGVALDDHDNEITPPVVLGTAPSNTWRLRSTPELVGRCATGDGQRVAVKLYATDPVGHRSRMPATRTVFVTCTPE